MVHPDHGGWRRLRWHWWRLWDLMRMWHLAEELIDHVARVLGVPPVNPNVALIRRSVGGVPPTESVFVHIVDAGAVVEECATDKVAVLVAAIGLAVKHVGGGRAADGDERG